MIDRMAKPCKHCPFRRDVTPFLHPKRAAEIAYSSQNRYSDFPCHKTTEFDDDSGEGFSTNDSKTCAGFFAMQLNETADKLPDGFVWPDNVYSDPHEMAHAYEDEWKKLRRRK